LAFKPIRKPSLCRPKKRVSDDEFAMWRAVFAFALADGELTLEKQKILTLHVDRVPFSFDQIKTLRNVMRAPQNVENLYRVIISKTHREEFCALARTLVGCDGDIDLQEKKILQHVGCFNKRDALAILKNSSKCDVYAKYTEAYETTSRLKCRSSSFLFGSAA